jgi:hypothetical protein
MPNLTELVASENLIGSFDVDAIERKIYCLDRDLTIKRYKQSNRGLRYYLGYPNKEVQISLNDYMAAYLTQVGAENERLKDKLDKYFEKADIEGLRMF